LGQAYQSGSVGASGGTPSGGQPSGGQPSGGQPSGGQPYGGPVGGAPYGRLYPRPNYGNVGGRRAFLARLVSASGWFAFQASATRRLRGTDWLSVAHYNRWAPWTLLLPSLFLALGLGLLGLFVTGRLGSTAPIAASIDYVYQNGAPSDPDGMPQNWVTVGGRVGSWSADAGDSHHPSHRIYLLMDPDSGNAIVVKSSKPLGEAGTRVEVTGMLVSTGGIGISPERDLVHQAAQANPSVHVADHLLDATMGAPISGPVLATPLLLLLGLFFLPGIPAGYLVFIRDRQNPPSSLDVPTEDAAIHLSGLVVDSRGKLVRLREIPGRISQGYYGLLTGPVSVFSDAAPPVVFEVGETPDVRTGFVYPWRGPRPAIRLEVAGRRIVLSFGSIADRDKWANLLLGAQGG
jgi:hypothetical protein